jgi:hypothetical protein
LDNTHAIFAELLDNLVMQQPLSDHQGCPELQILFTLPVAASCKLTALSLLGSVDSGRARSSDYLHLMVWSCWRSGASGVKLNLVDSQECLAFGYGRVYC